MLTGLPSGTDILDEWFCSKIGSANPLDILT